MKRLTENYSNSHKDEVYAEIQTRRSDRANDEGANVFDGINSNSSKDDMVSALEDDDKSTAKAKPSAEQPPEQPAGQQREPVEGEKQPPGGPKDEAPEVRIPDAARIERAGNETLANPIQEPTVTGDKTKIILDVLNSSPVDVIIIKGQHLHPDKDGTLIYVRGPVSHSLMTAEDAKSRFAEKEDGTVIYNDRGFDDVPASRRDWNYVDVVKLLGAVKPE